MTIRRAFPVVVLLLSPTFTAYKIVSTTRERQFHSEHIATTFLLHSSKNNVLALRIHMHYLKTI